MSKIDLTSTENPALYEEVKVKTMTKLEMDQNQCYNSAPKNHLCKKRFSKSCNIMKKGKILYLIVALMVLLLLGIAAVISVIYGESLKTKKELRELSKSIKESTIEFINYVNDSNDGLTDQLDDVYAELNQTMFEVHRGAHVLAELSKEVRGLSFELASLKESLLHARIFNSCVDVLSSSLPSGYYMVRSSSESIVSVYCNMTLSCGGRTGGWIRVTQLDFSDTNISCLRNLSEHLIKNVRVCRKAEPTSGCSITTYFATHKVSYSIVCGKIKGYQMGSADGFERYGYRMQISTTPLLNSTYLDGVSLTHGNLTQHIWSFVATSYAFSNGVAIGRCSCDSDRPAFVSSHFSCDQEIVRGSMEVLWDGEGCRNHNDMWFYRQLSQATTDDVEMRVCRDEDRGNEDILIQSVDIYIQ